MKRRPNFFIVGAPKSGTSALDHYLGEHPDVFMARKEMHFFGKDLWFAPKIYRRNLEAYLAEFEGCREDQTAGEASVWYLFSKEAAREIREFNPEAKIIIMLREPVQMMYSLYHQFRYDDNENLGTFEEALDAEKERKRFQCLSRQSYFPQGLIYRETASYSEQVQRYFEVFGRERVQVILFDDFVADPGAVTRQTLKFLELKPEGLKSDFAPVNSAKKVRSRALRWVLREPILRTAILKLRPALPRTFALLQRLESRIQKLNTRYEKSAPLSEATREKLRREFVPEVERLGQLLGRDLSAWSRPGRENARPPSPATWSSHDHTCLVFTGIY